MQETNAQIWGLDKDTYNKLASKHSKSDISLWLIGGFAYNFFQGDLISISSALLVIPGIFIASFAGIPAFWVHIKKTQILPKTNNVFVLLGFTVWYLVDLAYPVLLSILFVDVINFIISIF